MSRDQRPRRPVVIDNGPVTLPARRADGSGPGDTPQAMAPPPTPAGSMIMLWAILFLLACAAGAAGVAMMLVAR